VLSKLCICYFVVPVLWATSLDERIALLVQPAPVLDHHDFTEPSGAQSRHINRNNSAANRSISLNFGTLVQYGSAKVAEMLNL